MSPPTEAPAQATERSAGVVIVGEPPGDARGEGRAEADRASSPATVQLEFEGVSRLHQGYFSSLDEVQTLVRALSGCVGLAQLRVTYDTPKRFGRVELIVESGQLWCRPEPGSESVDLSPLEPVGRALASYRDAIASAYDFRVASFEAGVWIHQDEGACGLVMAGQYPPDGSSWSPCVEVDPTARRCPARPDQGVGSLPASSAGSCFAD